MFNPSVHVFLQLAQPTSAAGATSNDITHTPISPFRHQQRDNPQLASPKAPDPCISSIPSPPIAGKRREKNECDLLVIVIFDSLPLHTPSCHPEHWEVVLSQSAGSCPTAAGVVSYPTLRAGVVLGIAVCGKWHIKVIGCWEKKVKSESQRRNSNYLHVTMVKEEECK